MAKNFMEASTEIEEYIDKRGKCLTNIGTIIVEAVSARVSNGKSLNTMRDDIMKLISSLPKEDQVEILSDVIVKLSKTIGGTQSKDKKSSPSSLFGHRFYPYKREMGGRWILGVSIHLFLII